MKRNLNIPGSYLSASDYEVRAPITIGLTSLLLFFLASIIAIYFVPGTFNEVSASASESNVAAVPAAQGQMSDLDMRKFDSRVRTLIGSGALDDVIEQRFVAIVQRIKAQEKQNQAKSMEEQAMVQREAILQNIPFDFSDDHVLGSPGAKFSIVEYADYSCPYCTQFHSTVQSFVKQYDDVNWVYRHYPIRGATAPSAKLAYASECVSVLADNDLFWKYNDLVYANPSAISNPAGFIEKFSEENGLNVDEIESCSQSSATIAKVSQQGLIAKKGMITGTPGVIVRNNESKKIIVLPGAVEIHDLKRAMDVIS